MDTIVSSDGFAVVLEPTLSSLSIAVMLVHIKGANNNNSRYYEKLSQVRGFPAPGFGKTQSPSHFLIAVSCDEDDYFVPEPVVAADSFAP